VRIDVKPVVTVPVYEKTVILLVDVSVRVPEKLVRVVDIVKEPCLGPIVAAAE
jgi:hypothetical protein